MCLIIYVYKFYNYIRIIIIVDKDIFIGLRALRFIVDEICYIFKSVLGMRFTNFIIIFKITIWLEHFYGLKKL